MADTGFGGFTPVTALQADDLFLALRGAGGINFSLGTLFQNLPDVVQSGLGVSTGAVSAELGALRTGSGPTYIDLHTTAGSDYESRLIRDAGANGNLWLQNAGAGQVNFVQAGGGPFVWYQGATERARVGTDGVFSTAHGTTHFSSASTGSNVVLSLDPGNLGAHNRDAQVVAVNNGSNQVTLLFATSNASNPVGRWAVYHNGDFIPWNDNVYAIGSSVNRATVVFAATGTINTSDEREKTWRGPATDAELRAARRIIGELGFYQWNDAVVEKGTDARFHFGARAQRVWSIMADEGLVDPVGEDGKPGKTPYAFLCWDEWPDEYEDEVKAKKVRRRITKTSPVAGVLDADGKPAQRERVGYETVTEMVPTGNKVLSRAAGNRFGLRTDQLTLFLIAAQEARLAALEVAA